MELLNKIQKSLNAPKNQTNSFGKYKYRSCEDILEAVKPLLGDAILTLSDEIVCITGGQGLIVRQSVNEKTGETIRYEFPDARYYVKATATLTSGGTTISTTAYARESFDKKGMDSAQITGAASSYARKYAMNGLFAIDDNKDPDKDREKETPEILKPTEAEQKVIDAITAKLQEDAGDKTVSASKVAAALYASKGRYPDKESQIGTIVAYFDSQSQIDSVCEADKEFLPFFCNKGKHNFEKPVNGKCPHCKSDDYTELF